jgi:membrane protein implicated in regulation of membrane protease activity
MIKSLFAELGGWSWMIMGLILLILEIVVSGTFLLWFGVAALVVGIVTLLMGGMDFWSLQSQWITFVIISIVFVILGRRLMARHKFKEDDAPLLNQRSRRMIGREAILVEAISQGEGRVKLGDSTWRVTGKDAPIGTKVKVTGEASGTVLEVEAL